MLYMKQDGAFRLADLVGFHKWEGQHALQENRLIRKGCQGLTIKTVGLYLASRTRNKRLVVYQPNFIASSVGNGFQLVKFAGLHDACCSR